MPPVTSSHRRSDATTSAKKQTPATTTRMGPTPRTGGSLMSKTAAPTKSKSSATATASAKPAAKPVVNDIKQVWIDYKKNKTDALRNTLMENSLHLVRYNAERIHVK